MKLPFLSSRRLFTNRHLYMSRKTAIFSLIILLLSLFSSQAQVQIVNAKTAGEVANDFAVEINSVSISTDGRVMHYSGTAEPGVYVQVNLENNETGEVINLGETQADEKGNWGIIYQGTQALSVGMHTAQATSSSSTGSKTTQSQPLVFKVFYLTVLVIALILALTLCFILPKLETKITLFSKEEPKPPELIHIKLRGPPFAFTTCFPSLIIPPNFISTKQFQNIKQKIIQTASKRRVFIWSAFCVCCVAVFWLTRCFEFLPGFQAESPLDRVFYSSSMKYNTLISYSNSLFCMKNQPNQSKNAVSPASPRLFLAISLMDKPEQFIQLLKDLFSPQELENLVKRFEVTELLAKGNSYDQIEKITGVSTGTIAKVSASFIKNYKGYKISIERITSKNNV